MPSQIVLHFEHRKTLLPCLPLPHQAQHSSREMEMLVWAPGPGPGHRVVSLVMEPNDVCPIGVAWAQVLMLMVIKDITREETMCYPPCPYTERWSFLKWQNIQLLINVNHLHPPAILKI